MKKQYSTNGLLYWTGDSPPLDIGGIISFYAQEGEILEKGGTVASFNSQISLAKGYRIIDVHWLVWFCDLQAVAYNTNKMLPLYNNLSFIITSSVDIFKGQLLCTGKIVKV